LVLIANDQEWSARSIESVLAPQGFAILRAFTGQQAIDRALSARPDLILLDAQLPDIHGFDVCRRLRDDPLIGHAVPIIITTAGPSGRQQRLEASRAGAWDFLGQPLDAELMLARVEAFVRATDELRRSREDALVEDATGLYTARGVTRRLREIAAEAARRRLPLACVVFTPEALDDGGTLDAGTLTGLGTALRRAGRESDVLGRLSTDEFVVVAPATGEAGAHRLAERLQGVLAPELQSLGVRLRAGCSAVEDVAASRLDEQELLARALGRAKHGTTNGNGSSH
jgi:PleD family two-component response regulator